MFADCVILPISVSVLQKATCDGNIFMKTPLYRFLGFFGGEEGNRMPLNSVVFLFISD